ncbi:hypothetical protein Amn_pb00260 (plasmid) [Aminobacter sp. Y103A]|nr:hypothetical protein Amn_pb00260 [Aminobacter sp. SS-2016]
MPTDYNSPKRDPEEERTELYFVCFTIFAVVGALAHGAPAHFVFLAQILP